jgi:hypothetical protein
MPDTDLHQPGAVPLRAAADVAELAWAASGLVTADGYHLLRLDLDRCGTHTGTRQARNTAIGCNLRAFRYPPGPFGSGGGWLVTGHRGQDPGAGR